MTTRQANISDTKKQTTHPHGTSNNDAAFQAGRLVNQFRWHAIQALFLKPIQPEESNAHFEQSHQVYLKLWDLMGILGIGEREEINLVAQKWSDHYNDPSLFDQLWEFNRQYQTKRASKPSKWTLHQQACIAIFNHFLGGTCENLREVFRKRLNGKAKKYFKLGEELDYGVRPPNVYHQLHATGSDGGRVDQAAFGANDGYVLASISWKEGALSPSTDWYFKFAGKINELVDVPSESEWTECQTAEERIEFVEALDERIRGVLDIGEDGEASPDFKHTNSAETTRESEARHSADYRCVWWFGTQYSFTGNQAAIVKKLWEHWEDGTPEVSLAYLLDDPASDICNDKMGDIFRIKRGGKNVQHPAWKKMIVTGERKGTYRLAKPTDQ